MSKAQNIICKKQQFANVMDDGKNKVSKLYDSEGRMEGSERIIFHRVKGTKCNRGMGNSGV